LAQRYPSTSGASWAAPPHSQCSSSSANRDPVECHAVDATN
jgi:hypothetical protein